MSASLPTPAPPPDTPPQGARVLSIRFTGSGRGYFRIWIFNTLLIFLTLGLYWPFAKARRLRWFHANTLIDGHALAFHGESWPLFRGFAVMAALTGVYLASGLMSATVASITALGLAAAWPLLWRSGLRFRLAQTSWRGLRLGFAGDVKGAYAASTPVLLPLIAMVLLSALGPPALWSGHDAAPDEAPEAFGVATTASLVLTLILALWGLARSRRYHLAGIRYAAQSLAVDIGPGFYLMLMGQCALILLAALPVALIVALVLGVLPHEGDPDAAMTDGVIAGLGVMLVTAATLVRGWWTALEQDRLLNACRSAELRFHSRLTHRSLGALHARNLMWTLLTMGLYRPFAVVAVSRMRWEAVTVEVHGDVDTWTAGAAGQPGSATGEFGGDLLGQDISL